VEKIVGVDFVLIDDSVSFTNTLEAFLKERGLSVDVYNDAYDFLRNLYIYPKDTKIISDYDLKTEINGFDLLKKSHESGYTKLYILSGNKFEKQDLPPYLVFVSKDTDSIEGFIEGVSSASERSIDSKN
jgi:hypothetical protein